MAITTTTSLDFTQKAFEMLAYFPLRPELFFDHVADVKPNYQSYAGSSVQFTIVNDLPVAASSISATVDITPVAMSDSTVNVALAEYGQGVTTNAALRAQSFVEIDPVVANAIGYNAGVSIDTVARNTLRTAILANGPLYWGNSTGPQSSGGSNTVGTLAWTAGSPGSFSGTGSYMRGADFAVQRARLRSSSVVPFAGGFYVAFVHPDCVFDIQQDTGASGWRTPQNYTTPENIWAGEMGAFEGCRFIETPRAPVFPSSLAFVTLTSGSLTGTFESIPPLVGATLTASGSGGYTLSASDTVTVATVNAVAGTFTVTISSAGTVTGTGTGTCTANIPADQIGSGLDDDGYPIGDVYMAFVMGRQSLAKTYAATNGYGELPTIVPGPVVDSLRRFQPLSWKAMLGYGGFRPQSLRAVIGVSSLNYIDQSLSGADA